MRMSSPLWSRCLATCRSPRKQPFELPASSTQRPEPVPDGSVRLWTLDDGSHLPNVRPNFGEAILQFLLAHPKLRISASNRPLPDPWAPVPGRGPVLDPPAPNPFNPQTTIAYWRVYWRFMEPEQGQYRWDMLDRALERVIDGTDSRIRLVPNYKRKLFKSILVALQYADRLVQQIPHTVDLDSRHYVDDPYIRALFPTIDSLRNVCHQSSELREFFGDIEHRDTPEGMGLLCMQKHEETVFGMELKGEHVVRDICQQRIGAAADPEVGNHLARQPARRVQGGRRRQHQAAPDSHRRNTAGGKRHSHRRHWRVYLCIRRPYRDHAP